MKNNIKHVIDEVGITQKELAAKIGMSESGLSKAINGTASSSTIERISKSLNIDKSELVCADKISKAKYGSDKTPLRFGNLEIPCYVLDNGLRVLSGRGIQKALGATSTSGAWLGRFVANGVLKDWFCTGENCVADRISNPIRFTRNNAGGSQSITYGYEATLLIDICSTIIEQNRAGNFNDEIIVRNADIIIRSVAKVGIIALIDEVTGYDKEKTRAKDELQQFLRSFISEEASRWVKTFPDKFFEDLYRMRGWTWATSTKRPSIVGKLINDLIYDRLGPALTDELNRVNPKNENGNRKSKHHQFLTEVGKPKLLERIEALHVIAVISNHDWLKFMRHVEKVYPKDYATPSLFDDEDFWD